LGLVRTRGALGRRGRAGLEHPQRLAPAAGTRGGRAIKRDCEARAKPPREAACRARDRRMSPTRLLKLGTLVMVTVHRVVVALCSHSHFIGHPGPPGCPTGRRSAPRRASTCPCPVTTPADPACASAR